MKNNYNNSEIMKFNIHQLTLDKPLMKNNSLTNKIVIIILQ